MEEWGEIDQFINPGQYTRDDYEGKRTVTSENQLAPYYDLDVIARMAIADSHSPLLRQGGYLMREIGKYDVCDERCYKVALVLDPNAALPDYHWYRQNADGTWSHKLGMYEITCYDASGNMIYDPQSCDKDHSPDHDYSSGNHGIEFFSVEPPYVYGETQL